MDNQRRAIDTIFIILRWLGLSIIDKGNNLEEEKEREKAEKVALKLII
jgi:hypothetical protein